MTGSEEANAREGPASIYHRAGELFDTLVELDPGAREEALERARSSDPEAAQLAARMLARDATAGPLAQLSSMQASVDPLDPAGVLGTEIGPYRIESLIGRGGMGAVYLARREDPVQRVAIKFITISAPSAAALERFRSEASLLARLDHPGVVRYRDSGVDSRGRPYLVMDFVDGEPLSCETPEIAADAKHAVAAVAAVAESVHHLHQRRVLHRDLKPSNVLVKRQDGALSPVVIDLGVARVLADPDDEGIATGTLGLGPVGTPSFMSPEQAQGRVPADIRTDVHALGALLYALLTGHAPRGLDEPAASDPLEFQRRLRETEARAPSRSVDPETFGAEVARKRARRIDRDLDAVVLKALALRPDDRYGSAEGLAADLRDWLHGLPVSARLVGPVGRLQRLAKRRPLESAVAGVVGGVLAVLLVATMKSRAGELKAQGRYVEQLDVSRNLNRFFTEDILMRASLDRDGPNVPAIDLLRSAAATLARRDDLHPAIAVGTGGALMAVFERMGASAEADAELARAGPVAASLAADDRQRLDFETKHGIVLLQRGLWSEAEARFRGVLRVFEDMREPYVDVLMRAAGGLGHALLSAGSLDEAEVWFDYALQQHAAALARGDSDGTDVSWEIRGNLAYLKGVRGDRSAAIDAFNELLEELAGKSAHKGPVHVTIHATLASFEFELGNADRALEHANRAHELATELFEPGHPERLLAMNNLATVLGRTGSVERSIELHRECYEIRLERLGAANPGTAASLHNLATTLARAGRADEARVLARQALDTLLEILGEEHALTASAYNTLGVVHGALGHRELALELYDASLHIYGQLEGDNARVIAETRANRDSEAAKGGR